MTVLLLGLLLFLGAHSVRIFSERWRTAQVARLGALPWKAIVSVTSLAGLALIAWGYGNARAESVWVWNPPVWTSHLTSLLTLPAFVLFAAAYTPDNRLRHTLGHPMIVGVKLWALAHLISNGRLVDLLLFGAFLVWALFDFRASRRRDAAAGIAHREGSLKGDLATLVAGLAAWAVFALYLHAWLIGVPPF